MVSQAVRQAARRRVREALDARHKAQLECERRQSDLAVQVLSAIAERNQAVIACDQTAGAAVRELLKEGLDLSGIDTLCGDQVGAKELQRLAKLPSLEVPGKAS